MDHLWTNPNPCTGVRELVMRAVGIDWEVQDATVEFQGFVQRRTKEGYMMNSVELDTAWNGKRGGEG